VNKVRKFTTLTF